MNKEVTDPKILRSFGLIVGGVFGILGVLPFVVKGQSIAVWAIAIAIILVLPALASPNILRWPYKGWMFTGKILGWINTRLILAAIFYLIFTPVGLIMRLFGYDSLSLRYDKLLKSYKVQTKPRKTGHYERQF